MRATQIRMKPGCGSSQSLLEIDEIYITGIERFMQKELVHEYLLIHPETIQVDILPFPNLLPARSAYGERYVRSAPNDYLFDNLLALPRR